MLKFRISAVLQSLRHNLSILYIMYIRCTLNLNNRYHLCDYCLINVVFVALNYLRVNGFCYPTRHLAKSLLRDPTLIRGLITRPDPTRGYGSGGVNLRVRVYPQTSISDADVEGSRRIVSLHVVLYNYHYVIQISPQLVMATQLPSWLSSVIASIHNTTAVSECAY